MNWRRVLTVTLAAATLSGARATVEFSAFVSVAGDFRFIVTNSEARTNSGWLSLGDTFESHRLARFDARDELLTLVRGEDVIRLRLKDDRVEPKQGRQRRTLTGAPQKREIPIWVDGWGNLALGGTAVSLDELEQLFRDLAEVNATVQIVFLESFRPAQAERMRGRKNAVLGRAQVAGLKQFGSRNLELPPAPR